MFQKFRYSLAVPKIKRQINLIFFFSSIIPICIFGLFAIFNARNQMLRQYESQLETDALRVNSTLFDLTTTIRISTANILDNESYWNLFNETYTEDSAGSYQSLVNYLHTFRNNTAAFSSGTPAPTDSCILPAGIRLPFSSIAFSSFA